MSNYSIRGKNYEREWGRIQRRIGEIAACDVNLTLSEGERKGRLGRSILDGHTVKGVSVAEVSRQSNHLTARSGLPCWTQSLTVRTRGNNDTRVNTVIDIKVQQLDQLSSL